MMSFLIRQISVLNNANQGLRGSYGIIKEEKEQKYIIQNASHFYWALATKKWRLKALKSAAKGLIREEIERLRKTNVFYVLVSS